MHPLPFKSPIFFETLVLMKNAAAFLQRRVGRVRIAKTQLIHYFSMYLFTRQIWYILLKIDSEKKRFYVFANENIFILKNKWPSEVKV